MRSGNLAVVLQQLHKSRTDRVEAKVDACIQIQQNRFVPHFSRGYLVGDTHTIVQRQCPCPRTGAVIWLRVPLEARNTRVENEWRTQECPSLPGLSFRTADGEKLDP